VNAGWFRNNKFRTTMKTATPATAKNAPAPCGSARPVGTKVDEEFEVFVHGPRGKRRLVVRAADELEAAGKASALALKLEATEGGAS